MSLHLDRIKGDARHKIAAIAGSAAGLFGREILSKEATLGWIESNVDDFAPGEITVLEGRQFDILRWGALRIDGKQCLDLDYGVRSALAGWTGRHCDFEKAAALWSHPWMGYYHWVIDVAPKIAMLQEKFGTELDGWKLCYPRSGEAYEDEFLSLLGVPASALVDTRKLKSAKAGKVAFSMLPGWYQIQPSASLLVSRLHKHGAADTGKRIYVSRVGRRRCVNETEVFEILKKAGFDFIEDKPRTVSEQIGIFRNAEVIVAPHGAALTNLLWCQSGTKVIELFGKSYQPPYYRNLSDFHGLGYHSLGGDNPGSGHWTAVDENIEVDTGSLQRLLDSVEIR